MSHVQKGVTMVGKRERFNRIEYFYQLLLKDVIGKRVSALQIAQLFGTVSGCLLALTFAPHTQQGFGTADFKSVWTPHYRVTC